MKKLKAYLVIYICVVALLLVTSYSNSPLYANEGADSLMYKFIGQNILNGKILYKDIIDHIGPLLYFINALGLWISPSWGLFFLQTISLTFFLVLLYKIARLFCPSSKYQWKSILCVALLMPALVGLMDDGNTCEEWMLPWLAWGLYLSLSFLLKEKNEPSQTELPLSLGLKLGLCCGIIAMIRPNDSLSMLGGCFVGLAIYLIRTKRRHDLWRLTYSFAITASIPVLSFIIYFAANNALTDFYEVYIVSNLYYTKYIELSAVLINKTIVLIFFIYFIIVLKKRQELRHITLLLAIVAFSQLLLIGNLIYHKYFLVLLPILVVWLSVMCFYQDNIFVKVFAGLFMILPVYYYVSEDIYYLNFYWEKDFNKLYDRYNKNIKEMVDLIPQQERDSVFSVNLYHEGSVPVLFSGLNILYISKICPMNPSFNPILNTQYTEIYSEKYEKLFLEKRPKWLIAQEEGVVKLTKSDPKIDEMMKVIYTYQIVYHLKNPIDNKVVYILCKRAD